MLFRSHGAAWLAGSVKGQTLTIASEMGLPSRSVNLEHLRRIMALRLEEIFTLIERELVEAGLLDYIRAGVFICGGGARIPQIQKLAEEVFQMPVNLGRAKSLSGLKSALDQPEFATGIGLVRFGALQHKKRKRSSFLTTRWRETFGGLFRRN